MQGLTEGRIVHFVMPNGEHRPAIVVRVWRDLQDRYPGYCDLQVFTDGTNDGPENAAGIRWETSIQFSKEPQPRTWHWPERE